jgi:hypothetical protein
LTFSSAFAVDSKSQPGKEHILPLATFIFPDFRKAVSRETVLLRGDSSGIESSKIISPLSISLSLRPVLHESSEPLTKHLDCIIKKVLPILVVPRLLRTYISLISSNIIALHCKMSFSRKAKSSKKDSFLEL